MTFDPNQPFEVLGAAPAAAPAAQAPVGFDPSQPFEVLEAPAPPQGGVGRQLGIGARQTLTGLGGMADMVYNGAAAIGNAPAVIGNALFPSGPNLSGLITGEPPKPRFQEPFQYSPLARAGSSLADSFGLPKPETQGERIMGSIVEGAAGGILPGAVAPSIASRVAPGAARMVAGAFADAPVVDAIAGGVGGAAQGVVNEAGGGDVAGMGANLGGNIVGSVVASAIIAAVARGRAARGLQAPNPDNLGPDEVAAAWADPDVQRIAAANGITDPADPRVGLLQPRLEAARAAESDPLAAAQERVNRGDPSQRVAGEFGSGNRDANAEAALGYQQALRAVEGGRNGEGDPGALGPQRQPVPDTVALPDQSEAIPRVQTADGARISEPPLRGTADPNAVPFDPRRLVSEDDIAREAFDLANAQRQRATQPDTRDTQPAGVGTQDGQPVASSARTAQDFMQRSDSPRNPELPREAGPGVPETGPRQTYRYTERDPNVEFPGAGTGRTPFPDQGAEVMPPRQPRQEVVAPQRAPVDEPPAAQPVPLREQIAQLRREGVPEAEIPQRLLAAREAPVEAPAQRQLEAPPERRALPAPEQNVGGGSEQRAGATGGEAAQVGAPPRTAPTRAEKPGSPAAAEAAWQRRVQENPGRLSDDPGMQASQRDSFERGYRSRANGADNAKFDALPASGEGGKAEMLFRNLGKRGKGLNIEDFLAGREAGGEVYRGKPPTDEPPPRGGGGGRKPPRDAGDMAGSPPEKGKPDQGAKAEKPSDVSGSKAGTELYSGLPFSPANVKRFLVEPAMSGAHAMRDALKDSTALKSVAAAGRGVERTFRVLAHSNRAGMDWIARRHENIPEARALRDMLATDPGSGRNVGETYQTAVESKHAAMSNRLSNLVGKKADDATWSGLRDELTGAKRMSDTARKVRALLDEHHDYLAKVLKDAGVDLGYVRGKFFPRRYDAEKILADVDGFKSDVEAFYRKRLGMPADAAKEAAEDWVARLSGVGPAHGTGPVGTKHTKGRTLPPGADADLKKWMDTDPRRALDDYFRSTSKQAEYVRRFGPSGKKADEMFRAMHDKGMTPSDVALMRQYFDSSTGGMRGAVGSPLSAAADWIQTAGTAALLPGAVFSSLTEGLAAGARTGSLWHGAKTFSDTWKLVFNSDSMPDARRAAELIGAINSGLRDGAAATSVGVDSQMKGAPGRIVTGIFERTGLSGLTERQQIAATRTGQVWIGSLLDDVVDGTNRQASAKTLLAELGLNEADARAVHAALAKNDGVPSVEFLTDGGREGQLYRSAAARFVRETVQNAQAVDKPLYAAHPVGRMAYGITSFMFAFTRNVVLRSAKYAGEAITGEGYTAADRLRMVGPLMGLATLGLAQYGVSEVRERLFNPQQSKERDAFTSTILSLDRTGMFGTLSPLINQLTSAKYQRSLSTLVTGPYLSTYLDAVQKISTALVPQPVGPNSPRTNNAEHSAAQAAFRSIVSPLVTMGLSVAPGGQALAAAYGAGMIAVSRPGTARAAADAVAGPKTVKARTPGGSTSVSSSGGIRSSGSIRGGTGIRAN